jgi:hypothetical protein
LTAGETGGSVGFKAELGNEVGDDLIQDLFGGFERVGDVTVGEEEELNCKVLDVKGDKEYTTYALDLRSSAGLDSCRLVLWAPWLLS